MAWQLKVTAVAATQTQTINGTPVEVDLTVSGRWLAHVIYFDGAIPGTILYEQDFVFGAVPITAAQALETARTAGRLVRDARLRITELQAQVGTVFQVN